MSASSSLADARQYGASLTPLVQGLAEALKRRGAHEAPEAPSQHDDDPHELMRQFWLLAVLFRYNIQQARQQTSAMAL